MRHTIYICLSCIKDIEKFSSRFNDDKEGLVNWGCSIVSGKVTECRNCNRKFLTTPVGSTKKELTCGFEIEIKKGDVIEVSNIPCALHQDPLKVN